MTRTDQLVFTCSGERIALPHRLIEKYNVSGPRYTSYPTAPEWHDPDDELFRNKLSHIDRPASAGLSVYTHIPFCEERCHFCGCNVVITRQRQQADKYLDYLERELGLLVPVLGERRQVIQYHWGGGTPTYLNEEQIIRYINMTSRLFEFAPDAEVAIETDPRVTTPAQLRTLRRMGFNRISYGVQTFDPVVQAVVHRVQPFEMVRDYMAECRACGFGAINFDLMYGLPAQTLEGFIHTLELTLQLRPDRIALYNFAYLPQILTHQKRMGNAPRSAGLEKLRLFAAAIERFTANGYRFIGLDHFALDTDELAVAAANGALQRNFMGHTTRAGSDLIALGVSGISMFDDAYFQNEKKLIDYYRRLDAGQWPLHRSLALTPDDRRRRDIINNLLCTGELNIPAWEVKFAVRFDDYFQAERTALAALQQDGLVELAAHYLRLTPLGRLFGRNVAMVFDAHLHRGQTTRTYSKTV